MRYLVPIVAMLLLTGCLRSETGPRNFDISTATATPASADPQAAQHLLASTSKSYVTMVVYEASLKDLQSRDTMPDAVTSGSGFVVDNNGHVMTAGHVGVARGWYVSLTGPNGRIYRGKVKELRENNDMALIQVTDPVGLKPVTPIDDPCLRTGDPILSLGKPRQHTNTARLGSVASMSFGRPVSYKGFGYPDAMVLRLETRKGESGGPVFDGRGRLAGMVVSTLSDGAGRPLNLAHAVTAPMIADFICSATNCSPAWRALAARSIAECTGPRTAANRRKAG